MEQPELTGIAPVPPVVKSKRKTYVGAPSTCDICNGAFKGVMYNAMTRDGPWGNICKSCFAFDGIGLGTGLGQRYVLEAEGWIKVAG